MAKIPEECISKAREFLSLYSEDELREYVGEVFSKANSYKDLKGQAAIEKAIEETNNEELQSLLERAAITANNISKFEKLSNLIKTGASSLRELIVRRYKGLAHNVESAQRSANARLSDSFFNRLSQEDIEFLQNKENNLAIAQAFDGTKVTPQAKRIADVLKEYIEYRNSELVLSNAMPLRWINKDRYLRAIHDPSRLLSGGRSLKAAAMSDEKYQTKNVQALWREFIKEHLDMVETFKGTPAEGLNGMVSQAEADKILDNIYNNITQGRSEIFTRSVVANDKEAVERKSRMFFKWKSFENQLAYNEEFGKGDLFQAIWSDMHGSGNKIGVAEILGDSPYRAFVDLEKVQQEVKPHSPLWYHNTGLAFNNVMGTDKAIKSATAANLGANIRSLTSMARLPLIAIQSVGDIAYAASFAKRWGYSYWRAYGEHLRNLFNLVPSDERKYVASQFKLMVDSHLGYTGRFVDPHNTGDLMNKVSMQYFRSVGLNALDSGNKISSIHVMAKHLGEMSGKSFDALPDQLKKQLAKFDISAKDWDVLRKKSEKGLFTLDNIERLTKDDLKELGQERNAMHRKVYSMFDVASENAVLTPGAWIKAFASRGTRPGTWEGELARFVMQFKTYPLTYIDRVIMQGWKDMDSGQAKFMWALQMLVGTLPLSYMSSFMTNIARGRSTPFVDELQDMSPYEASKFLLEIVQPNFGIFMGILDPQNQNRNLITKLLGSPSISLISDAIAAPLSLLTGNPEKALKQLERTGADVLPAYTIPFLSPYLREILGEKAYLQPGQTQLYGA